jgi:hypothetical protein
MAAARQARRNREKHKSISRATAKIRAQALLPYQKISVTWIASSRITLEPGITAEAGECDLIE